MAAVHRRGVSQVAKETWWRRCRGTAATTQCRLAPVCEILITLNNLLICPRTHTISNCPKTIVADINTQTACSKGCNSRRQLQEGIRRRERPRVNLQYWC